MGYHYSIIRPGSFGKAVAADSRRVEFDAHNEVLIYHQVPIDFVFIGDSITHLWDVQSYFGSKGTVVVNRGIGGDETGYVRKRFSADVLQLKPKYVVIKIGINNTWILDAWMEDDRKDTEQIDQEVTNDIEQMLLLAQEQGIVPIICSILPTCISMNVNTRIRNALIIQINDKIKILAERLQVTYVDYHSRMVAEDGQTLRSELSYDGIHPDVYGYNLMVEIFRETLISKGITAM
jgi:lysophospholipase L1-like esterase